jgi:hypothetical protein
VSALSSDRIVDKRRIVTQGRANDSSCHLRTFSAINDPGQPSSADRREPSCRTHLPP